MSRPAPTIGFFTRLLDAVPPAERYRLALEQIAHAERQGFAAAWVAQHHFHGEEGGLPSPLVFLAHAAAHTRRIRLGTSVITLPLEDPVRTAEDAVVTDLLSDGRLEVGLSTGGTPGSFPAFGRDFADRHAIADRHLSTLLQAWSGQPLGATALTLHPPAGTLASRVWQATFSTFGGTRAGEAGHGLQLSRTQPRPPEAPDTLLGDLQQPIVDAYLAALPPDVPPRIMASRTLVVVDDEADAMHLADRGLRRARSQSSLFGDLPADAPLADLVRRSDTHVGTPEQVLETLSRDPILRQATHLAFQVHSVDPGHEYTLRSLELIARVVAPELGWQVAQGAGREVVR